MPTTQTTQPGVTFAVDPVSPPSRALPEQKTHDALQALLADGPRLESCCDYSDNVVADVHYQPLLAAVFLAFSQHRPLILTPDAVWITLAQGVAHHMAIHGEALRRRFVAHEGKLKLTVEVDGWVKGSPENPWPEAFDGWASLIRSHVGAGIYDCLVCDFSTTGPVERAASHVVMMDIFERYFSYDLMCICGIPTITLEGSPADWERLREKVRGLDVFDMGWWTQHLLPICDQFVRAARGDVDLHHWQRICKLAEDYGGNIINGWVCKLFPYLREWVNGPVRRKNPIFETGDGMQAMFAPTGLSCVPFIWRTLTESRDMEAIGGLVGVTQEGETQALRPKVGWGVRGIEPLDALLNRLRRDAVTRPGVARLMDDALEDQRRNLPPDMGKFYFATDGADLFGAGESAAYRIFPLAELDRLDGIDWRRICRLRDGTSLAMNFNQEFARGEDGYRKRYWAICHLPYGGSRVTPTCPVIAESFTELLARLLDSGGKPFWLEPNFREYGMISQWRRA